MQLKKLELIGFKSFAKKTVLDFSSGITAIVGPNGTGKSNITDAIRWVLTEQSFKSLRGKKSEDLIFHGSFSRKSLSRARVSLYFTNDDNNAPLDLEEIVIERQVKKDGQNNYILNNRQVRLMDLEVFLAKSGIGASSFRVLSQGMSDILVSLGPEEFKEFIEDAAGVKEYQDKKHRSLLKINSTRQNLDKISVLMAELKPRLGFLKKESNKFNRRDKIENELKESIKNLFGFRHNHLVLREKEIAQKKKKIKDDLNSTENQLEAIKEELFSSQKKQAISKNLGEINKTIHQLEAKERQFLKEVITLQGKISLTEERIKQTIPVTKEYLTKELKETIEAVSEGVEPHPDKSGREGASKILGMVLEKLEKLLIELLSGRKKDSQYGKEEIRKWKNTLSKAQKEREVIRKRIRELLEERNKQENSFSQNREKIIRKEHFWQEKGEQVHQLRLKLNEIVLEEEKILIRREQLNHDLKNLGVLTLAEIVGTEIKNIDEEQEEEKIWKLKNQLNEIGGIDPEVQNEYEGVQERYEFLEKESKDLVETLGLLEKLIKDLNHQIEKLFKDALKKMSESFGSYFRLMFGGGKASLVLNTCLSDGKTLGVAAEGEPRQRREEEDGGGIEIKVDLPGKKIKNLNMLSGGERSLVSIALLFALVSVRQPPFLVLDEIDAALDETNSQRFMRLLQELAKKTQFIIISHNRETMREADALYGVSMKDGISHLLSIKLESNKTIN